MSSSIDRGTLLLARREVAHLLDVDRAFEAAQSAFRMLGEGRAPAPALLGLAAEGGGFHIKAGLFDNGRPYFVSKTNANFMDNARRFGLPTIQGTIAVCDAENGYPLALLDSIEITVLRTAAATAVAATHLARANATTLGIVGCGNQGRAHLRALSRVRPIRHAVVFDVDRARAESLARDLGPELGVVMAVAGSPRAATTAADICVTCTPGRRTVLDVGDVRPGAFVAGVGADADDKHELSPALLASGTLVVDLLSQCAEIGDLHHAVEARVLSPADVHAELGEIVAGRKPGRTGDDEITIFDSTGMALQDAAAAVAVYEGAVAAGCGTVFDFAR